MFTKNEDLMKGIAIGLGAAVLVPVVITAVAPVVRSLARSAFKAGVMAYGKGLETTERVNEAMDDVVAEVEDELAEARAAEPLETEEPSAPGRGGAE